ncbi:hypothetical protein Ahy_A05g021703 isoform C [Arachis hypogaea]|uniref:Uncharacterized protein n=1 Tax=Arachis hypogaea TaxID=3818 RepID=A0A445CY39_ARAHY|nr:hypothetical protein Ahy_A05g021703 isoform C [Arachis hypogaea]
MELWIFNELLINLPEKIVRVKNLNNNCTDEGVAGQDVYMGRAPSSQSYSHSLITTYLLTLPSFPSFCTIHYHSSSSPSSSSSLS